jgi:malonyl CoA-acyl carrier protein transacylase
MTVWMFSGQSVLSALARLKSGEAPPTFLAGHSLGEYAALHVGGAFDFLTGLKLVQLAANEAAKK